MGPAPSYWTPYEPDFYLDLRQPDWAQEEAARWVRYFACEQGAFVYIHALQAKRVIEELGRLNAARPTPARMAPSPVGRSREE